MVARFLLTVLVLSLPFWALAQFVQAEPLPGLPVSALMTIVPAAAALLLTGKAEGAAGVRALLGRSFDAGRLRGHLAWLPLVLLMPAVVFGLALAGGGLAPQTPAAWWAPAVMLLVFYLAALGEELGWSAWLLERLERRTGELAAGLIIGGLWAAWHLIPFLQADRAADWIAWQCAKSVIVRVIMVRLYVGGGRSMFAVALFHAFSNVAAFSLPLWGGTYDPRATALALAGVAAVLLLARRR